jgi:hypothetical protein
MKPETYKKIKAALEEQELYLDNDEIDTVLRLARREQIESEHIGIRPERCKDNPREAAFQKKWLIENKIDRLNGNGTLQQLFIDSKLGLFQDELRLEINQRDRMVVATVIQWLGSNVGWCFLEETLKECGYRIVKNETK